MGPDTAMADAFQKAGMSAPKATELATARLEEYIREVLGRTGNFESALVKTAQFVRCDAALIREVLGSELEDLGREYLQRIAEKSDVKAHESRPSHYESAERGGQSVRDIHPLRSPTPPQTTTSRLTYTSIPPAPKKQHPPATAGWGGHNSDASQHKVASPTPKPESGGQYCSDAHHRSAPVPPVPTPESVTAATSLATVKPMSSQIQVPTSSAQADADGQILGVTQRLIAVGESSVPGDGGEAKFGVTPISCMPRPTPRPVPLGMVMAATAMFPDYALPTGRQIGDASKSHLEVAKVGAERRKELAKRDHRVAGWGVDALRGNAGTLCDAVVSKDQDAGLRRIAEGA